MHIANNLIIILLLYISSSVNYCDGVFSPLYTTVKPALGLDPIFARSINSETETQNDNSQTKNKGVIMHHNYSKVNYQQNNDTNVTQNTDYQRNAKEYVAEESNDNIVLGNLFVQEITTILPAFKSQSNVNYMTDRPEKKVSEKLIDKSGSQPNVYYSNDNKEEKMRFSRKNIVSCPNGFSGPAVYELNCKQFINCWKGRGVIQNCAPGTLFNPQTLECDYPDKVECLSEGESTNYFTLLNPPLSLVLNTSDDKYHNKDCSYSYSELRQHPSHCEKYLVCINGKINVRSCETGKSFNDQTKQCEYGTGCSKITPVNTNVFHSTETSHTNVQVDQDGRNLKRQFTDNNYEAKCPDGYSGVFPHPADCSKFLNCAHGTTYIQDCGPGTVFNPRIYACDFPYRVDCGYTKKGKDDLAVSSSNTNIHVFHEKEREVTTKIPRQNINIYTTTKSPITYHKPSYNHFTTNDPYYDENIYTTQEPRPFTPNDYNRRTYESNGDTYRPVYQPVKPEWVRYTTTKPTLPSHGFNRPPYESYSNLPSYRPTTTEAPRTTISYNYNRTPFGGNRNNGYFAPVSRMFNNTTERSTYGRTEFGRVSPKTNDGIENSYGSWLEHEKKIQDSSSEPETIIPHICETDPNNCPEIEVIKPLQNLDESLKLGTRFSDFSSRSNNDLLDYAIRLNGSSYKNEGRIEIKVYDYWGFICDDKFDIRDADVACRELGYRLGAAEVKKNSHFYPEGRKLVNGTVPFVMDDLNCLGNETSLRECQFNGWGIHDCTYQEVVGVVCKTPTNLCPDGYWNCDVSNECVPLAFMCDEVKDCDDGSDEAEEHCKVAFEVRLVNGSSPNEGRVEVQHNGVWGTICDDDFNDRSASVICRSLGYTGESVAKKDGFFGSGKGTIWLDQVNCKGTEKSLEECFHNEWGDHNCGHDEDAGVICNNTIELNTRFSNMNKVNADQVLADLLNPKKCGKRYELNPNDSSNVTFRVVSGSVANRGDYPWQASIRVKGQGKSSHWCGAIIVTRLHLLTAAHCLIGFSKGTYYIKAGDYDETIDEGTEIEAFIDDFYIHEMFRKQHHMSNDIALIKLKKELVFNDHVQAICLPDKNTEYTSGKNCTISGWGSTQRGKSASSQQLRAGWIPIQSEEICKMPIVYGNAIRDGMFCAGSLEEGIDSCDGDSGGPLACLDNGIFSLYGITSWGQHCGHANKPGVYVKVSYYMDWIVKKIAASILS